MSDIRSLRNRNRVGCLGCDGAATMTLDTRQLDVIPALDTIRRGHVNVCDERACGGVAASVVHCAGAYVVAARPCGGS